MRALRIQAAVALLLSGAGILQAGSPQTITFNAIPGKIFGIGPFALQAQASSLLSVTFTVNAGSTGVCTVSDDLVMLLSTGTCSIQATQGGDGTYDPATPVTQSFMVTQAIVSGTLVSPSGSPFGTGTRPVSVAVGIFNETGTPEQAGIPDMVATNLGSPTGSGLTVFLANGSGGYTTSNIDMGSNQPSAVAVGDFNGDGHLDLAVATELDGNVTIFLGDGMGGFTMGSTTSTGSQPDSIVVGDFNNDGIQDLATANYGSGNVTVLLGDGSGEFSEAVGQGSPFTTGSQPEVIVAGDFNGDGIEDLAVVNNGSDNVTILLGTGGGVFTTSQLSTGAGSGPVSLAVGDFNGDGKLDLAVGADSTSSILVFKGDGMGNFSQFPGSPITGVLGAFSLATGDFNGDGIPDLAAGIYQTSSVGVFLGDGLGGFAQATGSPFSVSATTDQSIFLIVADLNADGVEDLAAVDEDAGNLTVLLGGLSGTDSILTTTSPSSIIFGTSVPLTLMVTGGFNLPTGTATFLDGVNTLGTASQSATPYTFNATGLALGSHMLAAGYGGGSGNVASVSNQISILVLQSQTISFPPIANQSFSPDELSLMATATSGLGVNYESNTPSVCFTNFTGVIFESLGLCSITAYQGGDGVNYAAATPVTQMFNITIGVQIIAFDTIPNQILGVSPFPIAVQSSSLLPVTITSLTTGVCKLADNLVTIVSTGTCSIQATRAAATNYNAATPVTKSFMVTLANPAGTLTLTAASPISTGDSPQSVAMGDFNGDGIPDLVVANEGDGTLTVLQGDGMGGFIPFSSSPASAGPGPYSIAVGDFNGDGNQDLAVADFFGGSVAIMIGDGMGNFQETENPVEEGDLPSSVVIGDFNGDGIQDLAVSYYEDNNVGVYLGDGMGNFYPPETSPYPVGYGPQTIALGDFNGDGNQDIAVANNSDGTVTVLEGDGTGNFTPFGSPLGVGEGTAPYGIVVADFDGDGKQDLAVSNSTSTNVFVFKGDGSGGFTLFSGSPITVGNAPQSLFVSDFNGDGIPDLLVASANDQNLTVLLGNGSGGFTPAGGLPIPAAYPIALVVGDFNHDGIQDVAVADAELGGLNVFLGTVVPTTSVLSTVSPLTVTYGTAVPLTLTVTDNSTPFSTLSGTATFKDNGTSIGTAGQTTSQYTFSATSLGPGLHPLTANYGGGSGSGSSVSNTITIDVLQSQTIAFAPLSNVPISPTPLILTATASSGLLVGYTSNTPLVCSVAGSSVSLLTLGNCSITASQPGDGVSYGPATSVTRAFTIEMGSQTITFDSIPNKILGISPFPVAAQSNALLPVSLASTTSSVCAIADDLVVLLTTGMCSLQATQGGNANYSAATLVTRNFNVARANPAGTLAAMTGSPSATGGTAAASPVTGDFNEDGIPDIATVNFNSHSVTVLLGQIGGGFAQASGSPINLAAAGQAEPSSIAVGDFNGDGHQDLAVTSEFGTVVTVLLGHGNGTFTVLSQTAPSGESPQSIAVGDFNQDGIQDLAIANYLGAIPNTGGTITVLLGNGDGTFTPAQYSPIGPGTNHPQYIAVGDFNGDGLEDLAVANYGSSNITVLLGTGTGFDEANGSPFSSGGVSSPLWLTVGDFNQDGLEDLAIANDGNTSVTVLLGNVGNHSGESFGFTPGAGSPIAVEAGAFSVVTADFDGDGIPDLATANSATDNVTVLLGNGSGGFAEAAGSPFALGGGPNDAVALAVADFNGDGIEDLAASSFNNSNVTVLLGSLSPTSSVLSTTSPSNVNLGATVPLTLNVSDTGTAFDTLTGTVTFKDGATTIGTALQSASPYTFTTPALTTGPHSFTANYGGGSGSAASISNAVVIDVNQMPQTISFAPLSNVVFGSGPVILTATATSGLAVSFVSITPTVCQVAGNVVTPANGGTCSITASQSGDSTYAPAPNVTQSFAVTQGSQTISFGPLSNVALGSGPVPLTATATSGLPVSFTSITPAICAVVGSSVTLIAVGPCSITASQTGNAAYLAAPNVVQGFSITGASQTISFGPLSNVAPGSGPVNLTATATSGLTVTFVSTTTGVCTVSGNTVTLVTSGLCSITASQAGNANYAAAPNVVQSFSITGGSQTISFGPLSNVALGSGPVTLTATATSGLMVMFVSTTTGVCTVAGNTVTLVSAGLCSITASQPGNTFYAAAPNVVQGFMVTEGSQTITFDAIPNKILGAPEFAIEARASSGLPIGIVSTTTTVCKTSGELVRLLSAGSCSIMASQAGNASYGAAAPVTQSFIVSGSKPSGSLAPAPHSPFALGGSPDYAVTADFNGDGIPDVATANQGSNNVTVLLGDGSGGFTTAPGSPFNVGTVPESIAVADFNGDGKQDLAVANNTGNNVTVLLGNGLGGFAAAPGSPVAAGTNPYSIAAGDFNGDGIQDLAVTNQGGNNVTVLLGNGSGAFAAPPGSPFAVGTNPVFVALGDFNGDGVLDLAVANFGDGTVTVLLGNGSGGFTAAPGSPQAVGSGPVAVAVGDFNGDGIADIAAADFSGNNVAVLLGTGSGGFTAPAGSPFMAGAEPASLAIGDFNGDGIQDLAITNSGPGINTATLLLGNGSGGFAAAPGSPFTIGPVSSGALPGHANGDIARAFPSAQSSPFAAGSGPVSVVAADFNGDGILDLATANYGSNNAAVLLGGLTSTNSVLSTTSPSMVPFGTPVQFTLMVSDAGSAFNPITGTATFLNGATVLGTASQNTTPYSFTASGLGLGSHTLTANYSGGSGNAASSSNTITIQVNPAAQSITFGPLSNVTYGQGTVTLTATASSGLPVSFASTTPAVCTVSGSAVSIVAAGTCSITASQAGNASYPAAANVVRSFTVAQATQTIVFEAISLTQISVGSSVGTPLYAIASSGLPVTFSSSTPAVCTVSGSSVSVVGIGICSITASQAGNGNYLATSTSQSFSIALATQTITFNPVGSYAFGAAPFVLNAVSTSGLTVTFNTNSPGVCTVYGVIVTLLGPGTCSITASQSGNANFTAAASVTQTFTVNPPVVIPTVTLPAGLVNQPYTTVTLAAPGGSGTLAWELIDGSLPTGITLSGGGSLRGTPSVSGAFPFSVEVVDAGGDYSAVQALALQISPALSITTTTLPNPIQGVAYSQKLVAAGGSGKYSWSVSGGALPSGLGLSSAGALTGTPIVSGPFSFTAQVSDGIGTVTQSLSLQVSGALSITTSATLTRGVTGENYSNGLMASGGTGGPYTWSLMSGTLPSGLALSSRGALSGNPSASGTFNFTIQVNDGVSPAASLAASLKVYTQISITTTSLPNGTSGQAYAPVTLVAQGGSGTFTWSGSGMPNGLSLSSAGVLSGTPAAIGTSTIAITATDSGSGQVLTAPLSLSVVSANGLRLSTSNLVVGAGVSAPLSGTLTASGGTAPYNFTATGLPAGVTLGANGTIATIGGSGATAGTFMATVTMTDSEPTPASVTAQVSIQILGLTTAPTLATGAATVLYTANFSAAGGTPPYVFSATGLPAGLSFSGNGTLSGTVMSSGPVSFTVQTSDRAGLNAQTAYSLMIGQAPVSVPTPTLPVAVVGTPYSQTLGATGGTRPYTWSVLSGAPPAGLSLSSSGTILGIPTTPGTSIFAAQATDASGGIASASVSIGVTASPLTFTTNSLPSGIVAFAYPQLILGVTGGTPPYTFAITDGALPPGVTLSNGVVGGTPTTAGTFPLTITATDAVGAQADNVTSIVIRPPNADLVLLASFASFSLTTGATGLPPAQAVGVQSSVVAQPISYTVSVNPASPWLSVTSGGVTPGTLNLSLTSAALAVPAGTTQTIVTLTCTSVSCQGNTQKVAVTLAVASPPAQLSVTSTLLSFTSATTPPAAQTQPLGIQNIGGATLAMNSITCEAPWCKVGAFPSALTPGPATPVNITADPSMLSTGLTTGYYRTALDIAASSGTVSIPVTFFVTEAPSLNLSPAGMQFSMHAGGAPGNPKGSFFVTVAGGPLGWTATLLPDANWVTLNTGSGTSQDGQPATVSYVINGTAASLTPGPYYATIEVTSANASNAPQDYEIVLDVTPANQAAVPDPEPAGLLFLTTVGATAPAQTVTVYSSSTIPLNYQASAATANGIAWLSVAPPVGAASASTPGQSTVSINTHGLAPGVYTGGVSYASNSIGVRTVNVTLIVQPVGGGAADLRAAIGSTPKTTTPSSCIPTTVVPTQTGLVDTFSAPATWPINLAITLVDDCGNAVVNGTVVATFTNGDPELALPQLAGSPGLYSATWTPGTSAAQITITANAAAPGLSSASAQINGAVAPNAAPSLNQNGILNVFNSQVGGALAPGTVIAIYGNNLAAVPLIPSTVPLPTSVNGTSVRIGSTNAPLFYVSPTQINAQVPFELDPTKGPYAVRVIANGAPTASQSIQVTAANPALAAYSDGTVIAVHGADGTLVTQDSPAQPSEYIVMYLVGMGTTSIPVTSGSGSPSDPAPLVSTPVLSLNGNPVTYAFAGLTPTAVGLYQINLQVPADAPGGNVTLAVSQNGSSSNTTILPVAF